MKDGGFISDIMSNHTIHVDRSRNQCAPPRMETIVLNGFAVNHSQSRIACPEPDPAPRAESYSHCPPERWVCREIRMSPPHPSCQSQDRPQPGLGRSQTFSVKSVTNQKPPIHDGVRRTVTAQVKPHHGPHETTGTSEQYWRTMETSKPTCAENDPLSPSLDATIENLNNLILELDPTFQPFSALEKKSYLLSSNDRYLNRTSEESPLDGHNPGILIYDEWDSGRMGSSQHDDSTSIDDERQSDLAALCIQPTASSNSIPYGRMPNIPGCNMLDAGQAHSTPTFLPPSPSLSTSSTSQSYGVSPGAQGINIFTGRPTQSSRGPAMISSQHPEYLCSAPVSVSSNSPQYGSRPMPVPASNSYSASDTNSLPTVPAQYSVSPIYTSTQREAATSYLSTSAGSDNPPKTDCSSHTDGSISVLSTSPVWDTLGSSHSLLGDEGDTGRICRSAGSTYGSSGSFVNLQSPYSVSPSSYKSSFSDQQLHQLSGHPVGYQTIPLSQRAVSSTTQQAACGTMGHRPLAHHGKTTHKLKEHPSSCPASAASSFSDIPILLVNGSTHYLDQDSNNLKNRRLQSSSSSALSLPLNTCASIGLPKASSSTSLEDLPCDMQPTAKFVLDTSKYWYKPNLNRDQAIKMLKDKEPGSFIIRESSTYVGSFGLAMKVPAPNLRNPEENPDSSSELVRHFLIQFSPKGVCLKGSPQEPYFGSLSALVYQHCISAMSLPCKLHLPKEESLNDKNEESSPDSTDSITSPLRNRGTVCSVLYLNSVTMESLTGPQAVLKATSSTLEKEPLPQATIVQFKVSEQGITLTDSKRKLFFRRHYPGSSVNHCGLDPLQRKWRKDNEPSRIFAFVAKKQSSSSENVCHLFAEFEQDHSAHFIINHVSKILLEPHRM
ncbi:tensin-4-like [Carcharodon carcharias]|uniref:tensin-4-like n=1 Tax=Carcharodon carcharias TaxID=13397 RepID=UPI001B7E390C|nr:tensin-4-like [Carcharodon carcharias]